MPDPDRGTDVGGADRATALPSPPAGLLALAGEVAAQYAAFPGVEAVVLAGSQTAGAAGPDSDLDLYVYSRAPIPADARHNILAARADQYELDNCFWETGDEWIERATGVRVDVMLRDVRWIEDDLERVLRRHHASVGYSTCLWHNVLTSLPLVDPSGWFRGLQALASQPYPEGLRLAVIAKNHPILRATQSSYLYQIERALGRGDVVSVNHRVAALLASYFDVLFALNRVPHPGEKRLVAFALHACASLPADIPARVAAVIRAVGTADGTLPHHVGALLDGLDELLLAEGLSPSPTVAKAGA